METKLHTGEMIKAHFEANRTRKAALARLMKKGLRTILNYEKRPSIQTQALWELSHALKHNFFMDIAMKLPNKYKTEQDIFAEKNAQIIKLEQELELLKREREIHKNKY